MTDQLESDLRTLLRDRADAVTADTASGESEVARRLATGDAAMADVISLDPRRRPPWLVAAAALIVVAIGAGGLLLRDDDAQVRSGPVATDPTVPTGPGAVLEFRPVLVEGPCDALGASAFPDRDRTTCFQLGDPLPGNELVKAVSMSMSFSETGTPIGPDGETEDRPTTTVQESYGVVLQLTDDGVTQLEALAEQCFAQAAVCPTGRLGIVVDGIVLSAPALATEPPVLREIQISGDFTQLEAERLAASLQPRPGSHVVATTSTSAPDGVDPTLAQAGESEKDVAERVARLVFGDEFVTLALSTEESGVREVTMEDADGNQLVAFVILSTGRSRLARMDSPDLGFPGDLGAVDENGMLHLDVAAAGHLTLTGFDVTLRGSQSVETDKPVGPFDLDGADFVVDSAWVAITLEAPDGTVLRALTRP